MEPSINNISIKKIFGLTIIALVISSAFSVIVLPNIRSTNILFLGFLADISFYLITLLVTIRELKKGKIEFHYFFGHFKVDVGSIITFFVFFTLYTLLTLSSVYFLLRISIFFSIGNSIIEEILTELNTVNQPESNFFIFKFVVGVAVGPFIEEILFRGILLSKWAKKFGNIRGIIFSSLIFMLFHINSFFIPQLLLGILLAVIYIKTKQLFYPILLHCINNSVPFILNVISANEKSTPNINMRELIFSLNIYSMIFLIVTPIFIICLIKYSKGINKELIPFEFNTERK